MTAVIFLDFYWKLYIVIYSLTSDYPNHLPINVSNNMFIKEIILFQ